MSDRTNRAEAPGAGLTLRQRKFAELYAASGNGLQSALGAGYSQQTALKQTSRLLEHVGVRRYLQSLTAEGQTERIADVRELREFWTGSLRNEGLEFKDRLKASELLGKSLGMFIEKREHGGGLTIQVVYGDE